MFTVHAINHTPLFLPPPKQPCLTCRTILDTTEWVLTKTSLMCCCNYKCTHSRTTYDCVELKPIATCKFVCFPMRPLSLNVN
ncbi:hypothetical protein JHK82_053677 [Glycine max]|uniref:Uncharacterized protein n=1 Tax=Glycine soja TaxID=3848 RepID=A0A0B2SMB3_GLYSO|nr:hypothetical protein JHK86_053526 [Glycine max]KAG4927986.1 hypothetical protein JHK85_054472 [Glycine max]KAG5083510.1 hypothetical protein JHK84_053548 [Glycine max]KAG5086280.1 hypothetical protein JHK82_053677 [Glycine max]KHN45407.1 hypothetical protein glysoja_028414 [Glycine soja]